jgi:hypothetical protein
LEILHRAAPYRNAPVTFTLGLAMTRARTLGIVSLVLAPQAAWAHGQEILIPIYLQLASTVAVVGVACVVKVVRRWRFATIVGSILGAVASWVLVLNLQYGSNETYVDVLFLALPVLGASGAWWMIQSYAARRKT